MLAVRRLSVAVAGWSGALITGGGGRRQDTAVAQVPGKLLVSWPTLLSAWGARCIVAGGAQVLMNVLRLILVLFPTADWRLPGRGCVLMPHWG